MPTVRDVRMVRVFVGPDGRGGNPTPLVLDAAGMTDEEMQAVARRTGHESGFVLPPGDPAAGAELRMRYFVPEHEMEMCGHATLGALWALRRDGRWRTPSVRIETASGLVHGFARDADGADERIEITQPPARLQALDDRDGLVELLDVLGVSREQLLPLPILNAYTSRVKTLVPLRSVRTLDALRPDFDRLGQICGRIGSTGMYPFAVESSAERVFHARQFPRSSGYPEDAATGIAASALLYGLQAHGLVPRDRRAVTIHQGRAMGAPSVIRVRFALRHDGAPAGAFIGGDVLPA
jgi:PhzF family phenazine biosynthesis protein